MQNTLLPMWKIVTRSLFSKSACKMYPAQEPVFFERTRGRIEMEPSKCIVCTLCAKRCPTGAIVVDKEKNIWQLDRFKCILCGACVEGCKPKTLTMANHYTGPAVKNQIESFTVTPPKPRYKEPHKSPPTTAEH